MKLQKIRSARYVQTFLKHSYTFNYAYKAIRL